MTTTSALGTADPCASVTRPPREARTSWLNTGVAEKVKKTATQKPAQIFIVSPIARLLCYQPTTCGVAVSTASVDIIKSSAVTNDVRTAPLRFARRHFRPWRACSQSQEHRFRDSAQRAHRCHRRLGIGQVEPGV